MRARNWTSREVAAVSTTLIIELETYLANAQVLKSVASFVINL